MTMRNGGNQNGPGTLPGGWIIKAPQGYYTGHGHRQFERWTPFPKFAKVYRRQGWAQKIAAQFGGQAVPVE